MPSKMAFLDIFHKICMWEAQEGMWEEKREQQTAQCTGMWLNVSSQAWDKKASPERSLGFPSVHVHTMREKLLRH